MAKLIAMLVGIHVFLYSFDDSPLWVYGTRVSISITLQTATGLKMKLLKFFSVIITAGWCVL